MDKQKVEKIKDKIAKLIRKANSSKEIGSIEEAATFMMKANKLLIEHNLAEDDIQLEEQREDIGHEWVDINKTHGWNKTDSDWMSHIYNMISNINLCTALIKQGKTYVHNEDGGIVYNPRTGKAKIKVYLRITLVGTELNKEITKYMATSIINQLKHLSKKAWKEYYGMEKPNTWKRGYFRGAVNTLYPLLAEHDKRQREEFPKMGLMVMRSKAEVSKYVQEKLGGTRKGKSSKVSGNEGRRAGERDAHKVTIRKGISSSSNGGGRLLN